LVAISFPHSSVSFLFFAKENARRVIAGLTDQKNLGDLRQHQDIASLDVRY
jgi:hypothetical protein